jgi:6,7-dimethyl-8-ribityllumazine synthase
MPKILIISSNVHKEISSRQLNYCLELIKKSPYDYAVEILEAGSYEIPFVISTYATKNPFDAYIALGLVLTTNSDHYDYIMSHIKSCFTHFALNDIAVGNAIVSGTTIDDLATKIDSPDPCLSAYPSAYKAVDCLIQLKLRN